MNAKASHVVRAPVCLSAQKPASTLLRVASAGHKVPVPLYIDTQELFYNGIYACRPC